MIFLKLFLINLLSAAADKNTDNGHCDASSKMCKSEVESTDGPKLIFYDINPPEGFNLRRDVYMRFAIMLSEAHKRGRTDWRLVLPPWQRLYHWRSSLLYSKVQPWHSYFDIKSLKSNAPVIEMYEVFNNHSEPHLEIDTLYVLQNFDNAFENGVFEDKWQFTTGPHFCEYKGNFWGYHNVTAKEIVCVKFQGKISKLWELIYQHPSNRKVMFMHGEIPLHDNYGTKTYWDCRKSMKFRKELVKAADEYISTELDCKTVKCSNYVSIHWRRQDFSYDRPDDVPSILGTVRQIRNAMKKYAPKIKKIFIATDADEEELTELERNLKDIGYEVYVYTPYESEIHDFKEGGVAIIDQIICSRAAYFIGTHESTFTFRIEEEREILGFHSDTTFNRFCPDYSHCEKASRWTIVH